jgi:AcrR family transcriptional regulator
VTGASGAQRQIYRAAIQLFAERGAAHVSVSELAQAAGVARGTIYNNLGDLSGLFDIVARQLAMEMNERLVEALVGIDDPALRLATGLRLCLRRAHDEPQWGRFLCRFGCSAAALQEVWRGQPLADLHAGLARGRFTFREEQLDSLVGFISGAALGAIVTVLEGARTWREAGSDLAELVLIALGVKREEALAISRTALLEFSSGAAFPRRGKVLPA